MFDGIFDWEIGDNIFSTELKWMKELRIHKEDCQNIVNISLTETLYEWIKWKYEEVWYSIQPIPF